MNLSLDKSKAYKSIFLKRLCTFMLSMIKGQRSFFCQQHSISLVYYFTTIYVILLYCCKRHLFTAFNCWQQCNKIRDPRSDVNQKGELILTSHIPSSKDQFRHVFVLLYYYTTIYPGLFYCSKVINSILFSNFIWSPTMPRFRKNKVKCWTKCNIPLQGAVFIWNSIFQHLNQQDRPDFCGFMQRV